MKTGEIDSVRAAIREFGYDVRNHSGNVAKLLIAGGLMREAATVLSAGEVLIDQLTAIDGGDFLMTYNVERDV